jgi:hypothetical protein
VDAAGGTAAFLVVKLWRDSDGVKARVTEVFDVAKPPTVLVVAGDDALRASIELWLAEAKRRFGWRSQPPTGATEP